MGIQLTDDELKMLNKFEKANKTGLFLSCVFAALLIVLGIVLIACSDRFSNFINLHSTSTSVQLSKLDADFVPQTHREKVLIDMVRSFILLINMMNRYYAVKFFIVSFAVFVGFWLGFAWQQRKFIKFVKQLVQK